MIYGNSMSKMLYVCVFLLAVSLVVPGSSGKTNGAEPTGNKPELAIATQAVEASTPQILRRVPEGMIELDNGEAGPAVTVYNDKSPRAGHASKNAPARAGAEAFAYKGDYDSGLGVFLNYGPSWGLLYPGTMTADEFIMGNGFDVATDKLSGYELKVYRSDLDPLNGATLATYRFELWDGDPAGVVDTAIGGYAGAKIPGSECTWTDVPGPLVIMLHCDLPAPISIPNQRVWGVLSGDGTCRTGWRISSQVPEIGSILMEGDPPFGVDIYEVQYDDDGAIFGGGSCCDSGLFCMVPGDPCVGDDTGSRGFCSDGDAESAGAFWFGGPCVGGADDVCANFVFNAFAETDFTVTLKPSFSNAPATYAGNEITMSAGGQQVWLDVVFENWVTPVVTFQTKIDPSGYSSGLRGTLTPYNPPCTSNADCAAMMGSSSSLCNEPGYPPGGCTPAYPEFQGDNTLDFDLCAVNSSTLEFIMGCTQIGSPAAVDPGGSHPAFQMVLDVPADAKGTFTVGFDVLDSWMKGTTGETIPLLGLVPGKITVEVGQCCVDGGCVDDQTTLAECTDLGGSFDASGTCADPCPAACCLADGGCVDDVTPSDCHAMGGGSVGGICAGDGNGNGQDDTCPIDPHITIPGVGITSTEFGAGSSSPAIPADFFGPGSDPFVGTVTFSGAPVDPSNWGDASTLLLRSREPMAPSAPVITVGDPVPIEIIALSLISVDPITVTYNGGQSPEEWSLEVGLSDVLAGKGSLTATKASCNGGFFSMSLPMQPKFTFTNLAGGGTRELDTGLAGIPPTQFSASNAEWVHDADEDLGVRIPHNGSFVPGVKQRGGCVSPLDRAASYGDASETGAAGIDGGSLQESFAFELPQDYGQREVDEISIKGAGFDGLARQSAMADRCPPDSLYSQTRHELSDQSTLGASDASWPILRAEGFGIITDPICDVHWWGVEWEGAQVNCNLTPNQFRISIWLDLGGVVVQMNSHLLSPTRVDTGELWDPNGFAANLYEYTANLPNCYETFGTPGYVSIQAVGDPTCNFWWLSSGVGDGTHCTDPVNGVPCDNAGDYDLSLCITGRYQEVVPTRLVDLVTGTVHTVSLPTCPPAAPAAPEPTVSDGGFGTRMRYLSFAAGTPGASEAVRVQFDVGGFQRTMWVGQPFEVTEASGEAGALAPNFWAARLRCTPFFTDWSAYPSVHALDESVVPGTTYELSVVADGCEDVTRGYSAPLPIDTSAWGDLVSACVGGVCGSPDGDSDFDDIAAMVDKFKNVPGAPNKSRTDLAPAVPDFIVDFVDIPAVVDAFRGFPYPFTPPANPCP